MTTKRKTPNTKPTPAAVIVAGDTPFMRIKEAADYLRVAPWAIGAAIRAGELAHSVIGKRYIVRKEDLDAFAAKNRVAA